MMTINHVGVKMVIYVYFLPWLFFRGTVDSLMWILLLLHSNCHAGVTTLNMSNHQVQNVPFQCKIRFLLELVYSTILSNIASPIFDKIK